MSTFQKTASTLLAGLLVALALVQSAWALDLRDAKDRGWVGEMISGYLGVVDGAPAEAARLVAEVNAKRKEIYMQQARENGIALGQVEKIAAERNIEKTRAGHYVNIDGSWRKK